MQTGAACLLLLAVSAGCGGPSGLSPELTARDAALTQDVKILQKKQDRFAGDATALVKDIEAFRGQPGWKELAPILKANRGTPGQAAAMKPWEEKWKQPADATAQRYQQLVERSAGLEQRRKELIDDWAAIQAKERALVESSGINAKHLDSSVGSATLTYELNRVSLKRFGLDDLGLFTQTAFR